MARRFPVILPLVAEGAVTTTTVALLRPHLSQENHGALLAAARHKSKREVEHLVAGLAPKPGAHSLVRRLPTVPSAPATPTPPMAATGRPMLERSDTSPAAEARPAASAPIPPEPRPTIAPLASDRYLLRVTLSAAGHANLRRRETGRLEFHHLVPFACGGPSTVANIALRCRAHNNHEAEQLFGAGNHRATEQRAPARTRSRPSPNLPWH